MIRIVLFEGLVCVVSIYALWRGDAPERWTAIAFLLGSALSLGIGQPVDHYRSLDQTQFSIDLIFMVLVAIIAVRANRFWPLWFAAMHLVTVGVHLVRAYDPTLLPVVYGQAIGKMAWPMCVVLAIGTYNFRRRWTLQGVAPAAWSPVRW